MVRISENKARPFHLANPAGGFSLIELLIVLVVLGIVTGAVLTLLQSTVNDQLDAAAQVVVSDLYYVRNLAVSNNSSYRVTFQPHSSRYYFEHSGDNRSLDTLPASPYGAPQESPTRQTTDIALVSLNAAAVEVAAVHVLTPAPVVATDLEFGPLGETTRSQETMIWLAAGSGDARRYLPLTVNPVTGMTRIGEQANAMPLEDPQPVPAPGPDPVPIDELAPDPVP